MRKIIYTKNAPEPIGPYSQAVMIKEILYISGQIALNPMVGNLILENIESETKQVMENLNAILTAAGLNFSNIVKTSIFITDIDHFDRINKVYGSYFDNNPPAREVAEVTKLPKRVNVLVSAIAVR